jgi:predicted RNase H-like nuclease
MKYIGIDLAWTDRNETGICILNDKGMVEYLDASVFSNGEILSILQQNCAGSLSIGIDAPLIVKNLEKSRMAERDFMRYRFHGHRLSVFNVSRNYLIRVYGRIRGEELALMILQKIPGFIVSTIPSEQKNTIIETFPSAVCCGMFPEIYPVKYKIKPKVPFESTRSHMKILLHSLEQLERKEKKISGLIDKIDWLPENLSRKKYKHTEDMLDAFLCAYGLFCIGKNMASPIVFGNTDEGFITVPVKCPA